jgi:hypothetical protein
MTTRNQDSVVGDKWKVPSDVTYFTTDTKDKLLLVVSVDMPGSDVGVINLTYWIKPEDIDEFDLGNATKGGDMDSDKFNRMFPANTVLHGGNATELTGITTNSVGDWFTDTLNKHVGFNPVIRTNREIAKLYTQALLEGWTDTEIGNSIESTKWWRESSREQRQFQLLSLDQQRIKRDEQAALLVSTYLDQTGLEIRQDSRFIKNLAWRVAAGELSYAGATKEIQNRAKKDPASPYSTRRREYSRRDFNIENAIGVLRSRAHEWGVDLNDQRLERWARRITDMAVKPGKREAWSEEDFDEMLKGLAESQWGSAEAGTSLRQRDTSVDEWAAPYMSSYVSLMERGNAATTDLLFDRTFRTMLSDPMMTVGDFENAIRSSAQWLETNNGKAAVSETMAQVGTIFGFA